MVKSGQRIVVFYNCSHYREKDRFSSYLVIEENKRRKKLQIYRRGRLNITDSTFIVQQQTALLV